MTVATDRQQCGHSKYPTRTGITVRRLTEVTESNTTHFVSITGENAPSQPHAAPAGTCPTPYATEENPKVIGDDPDIVTAALHALIAQPVDVFVMELFSSRPVSVIVPRHHLPLMIVECKR